MKQTLRQRAILKAVNDEYRKTLTYKLIMAEKFLAKLQLKRTTT
jgi:hypothetical protein